jgi:hypothetical protein
MTDLERLQEQIKELVAFKRYAEPLLRRYEETIGGPQPDTSFEDGYPDLRNFVKDLL